MDKGTDDAADHASRRRQTTTIRIEKQIVEKMRAYQAKLGEGAPSLAELVEFAWTRFEQRPCPVDRLLVRLRDDERKAVENLVQFLAGKSPRRRLIAGIVESLIDAM